MSSKYDTLLKARKFFEASLVFGNCPTMLNDQSLKDKVASADRQDNLATARNPKASIADRIKAIEAMRRDHPTAAAELDPLYMQLQPKLAAEEAANEKKARAALLAARKKAGVSIGMTAEEVQQSSWGRPNNVNRTTNARGTREQWVYDGGYLYFEDGVLTSIQN